MVTRVWSESGREGRNTFPIRKTRAKSPKAALEVRGRGPIGADAVGTDVGQVPWAEMREVSDAEQRKDTCAPKRKRPWDFPRPFVCSGCGVWI
jgi:hypothetical protein